MAKKVYAVKKGRKTGLFSSWAECKAQVDGFSGAQYKSFLTKADAEAYLNRDKVSSAANKKVFNDKGGGDAATGVVNGEDSAVKAYVDGSYNKSTKEFSYGMVILRDGEEITSYQKLRDPELATMRNVAGEIKGAEAAMRYAVEHSLKQIIIYHDYEGIARWCLGDWKTNKEGTKRYKAYYDSIKDKVAVTFVKVKGHSNDKYNDMADALAKKALGLR